MDTQFAGRTNYFKVKDLEGLKKELAVFDRLELVKSREEDTYAILGSYDDSIFTTAYIDASDDDDEYVDDCIEFNPVIHVMPYLEKDEIFVIKEVLNEGLRYVQGSSIAYFNTGNGVESISVDLDDIYRQAKMKWNVEVVQNDSY